MVAVLGGFALVWLLLFVIPSLAWKIVAAGVGTVSLGLLVGATFGACQKSYEVRREERFRELALLEAKHESLLCTSCAAERGLAAQYRGWYGTVHTFAFANGEFVGLFVGCNPGKCSWN